MLRLLIFLYRCFIVLAFRVPSPSKFATQCHKFARRNPLFKIANKIYSFFYWFPRKNLPDDSPPIFLKNSTVDFLSWYQIPHNLPPYGFLNEGHPSDLFCHSLPGNTLPLGNWDPWGLHQVSPEMVRVYRESEIKHGRLAMLGVTGFMLQEQYHPRHQDVGGLAVTHMQQLSELVSSSVGSSIEMENLLSRQIDFFMIMMTLCSFEIFALIRNWDLQRSVSYHYQYDNELTTGQLKPNYACGDYGFDPLRLKPSEEKDFREFLEAELNHGRLAMISFTVMFVQENFFGEPVFGIVDHFLGSQ